jgi:hypothetical protein
VTAGRISEPHILSGLNALAFAEYVPVGIVKGKEIVVSYIYALRVVDNKSFIFSGSSGSQELLKTSLGVSFANIPKVT